MNPTTFPVEPGDMADLRARLAERADELTLLDVAYRTIDSPVGPLLLAATALPTVVGRHAFWEATDEDEKARRRSGAISDAALLGLAHILHP